MMQGFRSLRLLEVVAEQLHPLDDLPDCLQHVVGGGTEPLTHGGNGFSEGTFHAPKSSLLARENALRTNPGAARLSQDAANDLVPRIVPATVVGLVSQRAIRKLVPVNLLLQKHLHLLLKVLPVDEPYWGSPKPGAGSLSIIEPLRVRLAKVHGAGGQPERARQQADLPGGVIPTVHSGAPFDI
jgi:hypothetical protein